MKRIIPIETRFFAAAFAALVPLATTQAGSFFSDFESGTPAGMTLYGVATVGAGGVNGGSCLQLTQNSASQNGTAIIGDLDSGTPVVSFTAAFQMLVGGRSGGDGFSFNVATDLPAGAINHEGAGSGLTIEFDTYWNGAGDNAPSIDVKVGGTEVATAFTPELITSGTYVDVFIQLNPDMTLTVVYDGKYAYNNFDLSAHLTSPKYPFTGASFGFGSQNGGAYGNKWLDNLSIVTHTSTAAFVKSFGPTGHLVQPSSPIDVVVTDDATSVNSGTVVLQLDGVTVTPTVNTASGQTTIHYAPPTAFDPYTSHTVSLAFSDGGSPANNYALGYRFSLPASSYVTVFSDGFESYTAGNAPLDKNGSGANAAPNGSGNPWFGPAPPNLHVIGATGGVNPHSGNNMLKGNAASDKDEEWVNLRYRLNNGTAYTGNIRMDWWFYDPSGPGGSGYIDYGALDYYSGSYLPANTDYPGSSTAPLSSTYLSQRLSLGANGGDLTKYQARCVGASDGNLSGGGDWFNTTATRSIGWHHARIEIGPSTGASLSTSINFVSFYIDDMTTPACRHVDPISFGYNVMELNMDYGSTITGYMDDVSLSVGRPPNLAFSVSGTTATLTWPGLDFVLQSTSSLIPPITWTDVGGATSPYPYDTTSNPQQFFRLRNY